MVDDEAISILDRQVAEIRQATLNLTSWNQLDRWLRQIEGLRAAA